MNVFEILDARRILSSTEIAEQSFEKASGGGYNTKLPIKGGEKVL